jgi:glycosyltransferase involved in cell wall biosynthesis
VDARPIDETYRWQDQGFGPLRNVYAWLRNAFSYRRYRSYDYILVDGLHFSPVLARKLGILPARIRILSHMGNQLPYFMLARQIPSYSRAIHRWLLNSYDHIFCEGEMIREIILNVRPGLSTPLHCTFLGPLDARLPALRSIQPAFGGYHLVTIASGPGAARIYYKGLDLMTRAFAIARKKIPELRYSIVGQWSPDDIETLSQGLSQEDRQHLFFLGHQEEISQCLQTCDLGIHVARGDAFPTSTIESLHAGLPVIVSRFTGTRQIIGPVCPELIVDLSAEELAERITWFFSLPTAEKQSLSARLRQAAEMYTESRAIAHYRNTFEKIEQYEKNNI